MTNSIYTSLQLLSVRLTSLPSLDTSPPCFAACNLLTSGGFHPRYHVIYRDWIRIMKVESSKYAEIWRTSCGTILGNFRETIRKKFDLLYYNVNIALLVLVEF